MNIIKLFQDYNIPSQTEGKNWTPGWVMTRCPFCDDTSTHLGYCLKDDYFRCWRCGWHPATDTLAKLLNTPKGNAFNIMNQYGGKGGRTFKEPKISLNKKPFRLPNDTTTLQWQHREYLEKRGFDPDKLEAEWGLLGTGPVSQINGLYYKNRIIAPIYWDGEMVSFQGRSISSQAKLRYLACPKERELIHHKDILYGKQETWGKVGICVEGITDVWRFGTSAFATFGIEFKTTQVKAIAERFEKIFVVFDCEPQAKKQAEKLVAELSMTGVEARQIDVENDPASMSQGEADNLVKSLMEDWHGN